VVGKNINNDVSSTTKVEAIVRDPSALKDSDYKVTYGAGGYNVTRLSDNAPVLKNYVPDGNPVSIDGIDFSISGNAAVGDEFLVRPTIAGASDFKVLIKDVAGIAAAAPIVTSTPVDNIGNVKISAGTVDKNFLAGAPTLPVELAYDKAGNTLAFPAGMQVTVVDAKGVKTGPITNPVEYKDGATYTFGGVSITLSGTPGDKDKFTIADNSSGVGDTRNIGLLGNLQTKNIFNEGTATLQSSYAQLVSTVGNKTREVQVNGQAAEALLNTTRTAAQDVSGVNLDEEATNLIKYQQAYQAAGKVMQIAGTIFDTLLSIGR